MLDMVLSLVEPDILEQSKLTEDETDIIKNIALEKIYRQPNLKEIFALDLLDDQLKELQYKTERHDHEILLESLKNDNEHYKKKYRSLNEKKIFRIVWEILIGSVGLCVGIGLTISRLAPVGIMCASSISFLSIISTLITNEFLSKLKKRYTKLRDWIKVITLLYEKTLKQSMVDKKNDEREAQDLKKVYNHYLDKRKEIMRNT